MLRRGAGSSGAPAADAFVWRRPRDARPYPNLHQPRPIPSVTGSRPRPARSDDREGLDAAMQNMALGYIRASVEGPNSVDTGARPVRWARVVAAIRPANRRVRTLYVPLGPVLPELAKLARCRVCCGLRYHTQRCGPERRADLMVLRAAKRINPNTRGVPESFQAPPPKPTACDGRVISGCAMRSTRPMRRATTSISSAWPDFIERLTPKLERQLWSVMRDRLQAGAA